MTCPPSTVDLRRITADQSLQVFQDNHAEPFVFHLRLALSIARRTRGLLGGPALKDGHGMLLRPCNAIHTFFMGQVIDAAMLDRRGEVVALYHELRPWRLTLPAPDALATLELPAGTLRRRKVKTGDLLRFVER